MNKKSWGCRTKKLVPSSVFIKEEQRCKRDLNFMYLLEGLPAPDHATFERFRSIHFAPYATRIMAQMSDFLYETGEISGVSMFVDGTKLEAHATAIQKQILTLRLCG